MHFRWNCKMSLTRRESEATSITAGKLSGRCSWPFTPVNVCMPRMGPDSDFRPSLLTVLCLYPLSSWTELKMHSVVHEIWAFPCEMREERSFLCSGWLLIILATSGQLLYNSFRRCAWHEIESWRRASFESSIESLCWVRGSSGPIWQCQRKWIKKNCSVQCRVLRSCGMRYVDPLYGRRIWNELDQ